MKTTTTNTIAATAAIAPSPDETIPIATLVPVLAILDSFNHRNKNQHRVARWWSAFDLLRRAVRRLHDALEAQGRHRRALSFKSSSSSSSSSSLKKKSSSSSSSKPIVSSAERRQNALDEDVVARVRMLLDSTIPSSFSAFTQLAADNQHAALGLVLLGLLARINSVVTLLAPAPAPTPAPRSEKATPASEVTTTSSLSTGRSDAAVAVADERQQQQPNSRGLGVAISRDQLKLAAKPSDHNHASSSSSSSSSSSRNVAELTASIPPKKRKLTAGPPLETKASKPAKEEKLVKKKKKSKKTDDFGDLFSSLM
ncbi:hypothetical protein BDP81DRAFT_391044 [Colletotrichum phormii]|uniref:RNase MRP protein 1 RNA binding domain-containing protein n=1 Tax=Colletotrichum phormii TaxID=359342 RepID=A0AAI9ZY38_9PEZI|nr:uncharacterized protein BDP81DRAFT_391044 [Colletotrichum phormii]KAK1640321.1 hypothetical protein BDP81DRAFT_391044 [Colletotrichum phormii]